MGSALENLMPSNDQANRSMCPVRCNSIVRVGSRPSGSAKTLVEIRVGQHASAVLPQADARIVELRPTGVIVCMSTSGLPCSEGGCVCIAAAHRGHVVPGVRIRRRRRRCCGIA